LVDQLQLEGCLHLAFSHEHEPNHGSISDVLMAAPRTIRTEGNHPVMTANGEDIGFDELICHALVLAVLDDAEHKLALLGCWRAC
jgi:hypothetical protein